MTRELVFVLALAANGACTTFHLPQLYVRGRYAPALAATDTTAGRGELVAFDVGVRGDLGDVDAPAPLEEPSEPPTPSLRRSAPCRVSSACAWERRAVAEARARVITTGELERRPRTGAGPARGREGTSIEPTQLITTGEPRTGAGRSIGGAP